jgi:hypothetical protein
MVSKTLLSRTQRNPAQGYIIILFMDVQVEIGSGEIKQPAFLRFKLIHYRSNKLMVLAVPVFTPPCVILVKKRLIPPRRKRPVRLCCFLILSGGALFHAVQPALLRLRQEDRA